MLPVTVKRVFLAQYRVDFRKGMDGLLAEANKLGAQPYHGDCVVFIKRDRRQVRALVGDAYGLYLVGRRFDAGVMRAVLCFAQHPQAKAISSGELSLLLEGMGFTVHARPKSWRPLTGKDPEPPAIWT